MIPSELSVPKRNIACNKVNTEIGRYHSSATYYPACTKFYFKNVFHPNGHDEEAQTNGCDAAVHGNHQIW